MVARIELALKIIATLIAAFGVWKYFADQQVTAQRTAKAEAISYVSQFGEPSMVSAREALTRFWRNNQEFVAYMDKNAISERVYVNFIRAAYPNYERRSEVDAALFRHKVFFDEIAFCREAEICDRLILDGFFCDISIEHAKIYGPFYAILSLEIGSARTDSELLRLAERCDGFTSTP